MSRAVYEARIMHGLIGESFSYKDLVSACTARRRQQLDAAAATKAAAAVEAAAAAKATEGAETKGQNPLELPTPGATVLVDMHLNVDLEG